MKASASAACQIYLGESHAHNPTIYPEPAVLAQVGEREIAEPVAHIASVVKEQERERAVYGERIFRLEEHGVGRPEAIVVEAAKVPDGAPNPEARSVTGAPNGPPKVSSAPARERC
jgi:hypothetical protein